PTSAGLSQISKSFILRPTDRLSGWARKMSMAMRRMTARFCGPYLAGAGIVFAEDDVEPPVQLIFHTPMPARPFEQALRREAVRQRHVKHRLGRLTVGLSFGLDAAESAEIGEGRRLRRSSNHAGAAAFFAVVTAVAFLIGFERAAGIGRREGRE